MKKLSKIAALCCVMLLVFATPVFAQGEPGEDGVAASTWSIDFVSGAFGAGLVIIAASYGISKIGSSAMEGMARQPEVAGNILTAMIVSAAMIEGATLLGLIVCMLSFMI